jgi:predicted methyltransferase
VNTRHRIASIFVLAFAGCAAVTPGAQPDYHAIVASPDRSDADRQTDVRRKPELLLAFTGVREGMKVLDMGAGAGYSTELIARVVGPTGRVYAQESPSGSTRARERFEERSKSPVMRNVVQVLRNYDDPVPPDAHDLDLVTFFFAYHDTAFMPVDRAKMNRALFDALKPGGVLVVADHSAQPGAGTGVAKTLHRIEESTLRREIEAAGFKLVAEGDFLRNPGDLRDTVVFRPQTPVDEFALKFVKPAQTRPAEGSMM